MSLSIETNDVFEEVDSNDVKQPLDNVDKDTRYDTDDSAAAAALMMDSSLSEIASEHQMRETQNESSDMVQDQLENDLNFSEKVSNVANEAVSPSNSGSSHCTLDLISARFGTYKARPGNRVLRVSEEGLTVEVSLNANKTKYYDVTVAWIDMVKVLYHLSSNKNSLVITTTTSCAQRIRHLLGMDQNPADTIPDLYFDPSNKEWAYQKFTVFFKKISSKNKLLLESYLKKVYQTEEISQEFANGIIHQIGLSVRYIKKSRTKAGLKVDKRLRRIKFRRRRW